MGKFTSYVSNSREDTSETLDLYHQYGQNRQDSGTTSYIRYGHLRKSVFWELKINPVDSSLGNKHAH